MFREITLHDSDELQPKALSITADESILETYISKADRVIWCGDSRIPATRGEGKKREEIIALEDKQQEEIQVFSKVANIAADENKSLHLGMTFVSDGMDDLKTGLKTRLAAN